MVHESWHTTFKLSQYCDDTTLFIEDLASADEAVKIIHDFGNVSGLQLNMDKCEFMWIGENRNCTVPICGRTPVRQIKVLGAVFSAVRDCEDDNLQKVTLKIQNTLNQWSQRDLTIKGRIVIAKSLAI